MPPQLHHGEARGRGGAREHQVQAGGVPFHPHWRDIQRLGQRRHRAWLFVELDENKCEGFVPKESFPWDQWAFDEDRVLFEGLRSGTKIGLGDPITIRVVAADLAKRQLEFEWLEDDGEAV